MTREAISKKNAIDREKRSKQLVISAITGMYQDEFKKGKELDKWNIKALAEFTHLTRQTVSKHLKLWEATQGGLFGKNGL